MSRARTVSQNSRSAPQEWLACICSDRRRPEHPQRRRFYPTIDPTKPAKPKPLHPIVIEGIGPIPLGKGYE
jgi:hypothetical protein